jgi:hypothetical protein
MPESEKDREAQEQLIRARAPDPVQQSSGFFFGLSYFAVPFCAPVPLMTPTGSFIPSSAAASSSSFV